MAELRSGDGLEALCSAFEVRWLRDAPQVRHRREAGTLMSADLSGFTALSERLAEQGRVGAERLTAMINSCFTALIDVAGRESGDVLKFGGEQSTRPPPFSGRRRGQTSPRLLPPERSPS